MADCPTCGSSNTKTMQMAYMSGLTSRAGKSGGMSISSRGRVSVRSGSSGGITQTQLSAACAPPQSKGIPPKLAGFLVWFFAVGLLGAPVSASGDHGFFTSLWSMITMFGGIYAGYRVYRHLEQKRLIELQQYASQWICMRCGGVYTP